MIGNDIVDLATAKKESNWKRKGFLEKIFTVKEQNLISQSKIPDVMVWNLWSRKEAAYKIFNRETGIRGFFPLLLECSFEDEKTGKVVIQNKSYLTNTTFENNAVYTIAVTHKEHFKKIKNINPNTTILKKNGIPFIIDPVSMVETPISITHHGLLWKGITLLL
ncbi:MULTISPECIES: 4'-phosphopantetheinyl transferase superfamily protein [unclassified Flavobacterium]|jgi:phosphopantetheinyl transferase (holo-ACP synthase)|uniref:4'-phosphopantetheinyl transferase family protein n=1 Tax=unclassified Flavobacterium TaxID=196869 RepID=UPI00131C7EB3|nr:MULTISPECIES: 4'-phosphopantetheinyl transferase superfamily protein [unclassified Flavobacterium]